MKKILVLLIALISSLTLIACGGDNDSPNVDKDGKKASYSRKGKVLSFFVKPDVCAFGGDSSEYVNVCTPTPKLVTVQ